MKDILTIKNKCKEHIYYYYSKEKQSCINELQGYTQQHKDNMWSFINLCRERSNYYEENDDELEIDYSDIIPE